MKKHINKAQSGAQTPAEHISSVIRNSDMTNLTKQNKKVNTDLVQGDYRNLETGKEYLTGFLYGLKGIEPGDCKIISLKLEKSKDDVVGETILFENKRQMEAWLYKHESTISLSYPTKEGGYRLIMVPGIGYNSLLDNLGIVITEDGHSHWAKVVKRIKRLFRQSRHHYFNSLTTIMNISDPEKTYDGSDLVSIKFLASLGIKAKDRDRFSATFIKDGKYYKSHLIAVETDKANIITFDSAVRELEFPMDFNFLQLEPMKSDGKVNFDIQTITGILMRRLMSMGDILELLKGSLELIKKEVMAPIEENFCTSEAGMNSKIVRLGLHGVKTSFPRTVAMKWNAIREGMMDFAKMRFPIPGAKKGYLLPLFKMVDGMPVLLDGDHLVYFNGNLMVPYTMMKKVKRVHGGADNDDNMNMIYIPAEDKWLVWRNPNQFSELAKYITKFINSILELNNYKEAVIENVVVTANKTVIKKQKAVDMFQAFVTEVKTVVTTKPSGKYDLKRVIAIGASIENGVKKLGVAASAIIAIQGAAIEAIRLTGMSTSIFDKMRESARKINNKFSDKKSAIDLEAIVDFAVQGMKAQGAKEAEQVIDSLFTWAIENNILFSESLAKRVPYKFRGKVASSNQTPICKLREVLVQSVTMLDYAIMGSGSGEDRVPGLIDTIEVDTKALKLYLEKANTSIMKDGKDILIQYKKSVRELMEATEGLPIDEKTEARKESKRYQQDLLFRLKRYSIEEQKLIIADWAIDTYDKRSPHDSHLFINSVRDENNDVTLVGTFDIFLEVLQDCGIAKRVNIASTEIEYKVVEKKVENRPLDVSDMPYVIRVWRSRPLETTIDMFSTLDNDIIVDGKEVLAGDVVFNLGDKTPIPSGEYYIVEAKEVKDRSDKVVKTGVDLVVKALANN